MTNTPEETPPTRPEFPTQPRYDKQNRRLCNAYARNTGEQCKSPAMTGQRVCRMHGGSAKAARRNAALRLAGLVDPAIEVLGEEMQEADKSSDRQRAANSILDRGGIPRSVTSPDADAARDLLLDRLRQIREGRGETIEEESEDDE